MNYAYRSAATCILIVGSLSLANARATAEEKDDSPRPFPKFTVGKDTTFITEPLTKEGYPDYPAFLNKMLSQGVTAKNNANVLFWQAHGPHPERATMPAEFFEWMGMESPPEVGPYFVDLHGFLTNKRVALDDIDKMHNLQYKAMSEPWKAADFPEIADWLKANEKPLALITEGAKRPKYFSPTVVTDEDRKESGMVAMILPAVQSARGFARALAARAMLHAGEGNSAEAWQDLQTCHRLGRHIAHGPTLIEGLVGIAIEGIAIQADLVFLEHTQPMRNRIDRYQRDLDALPPFPRMTEKIDSSERFIFLDSTFLVARGQGKMFSALMNEEEGADFTDGLFMKFFEKGIDWDEALKMGNEWFDRLQAALDEPSHRERVKALQQVNVDLKKLAAKTRDPIVLAGLLIGEDRDKKTGRMFGSIMLALLLPALEAVQSAEARIEQQQRNLRLAFALAAYQADHDRYPAKLNELTPKYIPEVPNDLLADRPLVYRLIDGGYLLYSVGPNGKDEGGNDYDDQPRGDDLRVRAPSVQISPAYR